MKRFYTLLLVTLAALAAFTIRAQDDVEPHDTVCVYQTWEDIFDGTPDDVLLDPYIELLSPFELYFETHDDDTNRWLNDEAVAVAVGDSLWMLNAEWLQRNFNGDCRDMENWVTFYFNRKCAFVQWAPFRAGMGMQMLSQLLGDEELMYKDVDNLKPDLYFIDFAHRRVDKVGHKRLAELLEPYPDLLRRFQSMKDYKKSSVVQFYFMEYVQRLAADPDAPLITDY